MSTIPLTRRAFCRSGAALAASVSRGALQTSPPARIRAFSIDFNWNRTPGLAPWINTFAKPGRWAGADPRQHVDWYAELGANVIQTFAVSCNGYAWYKDGAVPPQPGLKSDFLREMVRLGHARQMMVFGYFCAGSNTKFALDHPGLSYGTPAKPHLPFTDEYLDDLARSISDAVRRTGMDGFLVDWIRNPKPELRKQGWIEAEKKLYTQLTGKRFPEEGPHPDDLLDYERKAMERCWGAVRQAAKHARRDCIVWLSCSNLSAPTVAGAGWLREADWVLNEAPDLHHLEGARKTIGPQTRMVQCLVGWEQHDAAGFLAGAGHASLDLYGFAEPRENSLPLSVQEYRRRGPQGFPGQDRVSINDRNIAALARAWAGGSNP
jgi:hypothetical protein